LLVKLHIAIAENKKRKKNIILISVAWST